MFNNKVALVTGAATGIGRTTAMALAAKGAKVMVTDINETAGKGTVAHINKAGGQAVFHQLDVSTKANITTVIGHIIKTEGKIDMAVNNAGISLGIGPMYAMEEADWHKMMAINLSGVFFCMQAEIGQMLQNGGGQIVNVASLAGLGGVLGGAAYSATKHGVIGLTKTAAIEYGSLNIRVNAVCPGFIQTPILNTVPKEVLDFNTNYQVPMKRVGQPEEVANAITWLLSSESSYVNGHSLYLDGGSKAG